MIKQSSVILVLVMLLGIAVPVHAGDSLLPVIPEAQSRFSETQGCVEPTGMMRKNHMEYILHQRDETVYRGIRTRQYSLEQCINCHVSEAPDAPRVSSEEHFCSSCHTYAAVKIDCFMCHADRPVKTSRFNSGGAGRAMSGLQQELFRTLASEGSTHEQ
ncbi:MAG: sulfur reduction protein DsrJ [Gammaproteobacteria bacterium]